jgi:hypothetical protein
MWNARDNARSIIRTGNRLNAQSTNTTRLDSVIRIIIDSGLGYTLVSLTLFFSFVARSNALYITSGTVSLLSLVMYPNTMPTLHVLKEIQAVGIAFNLITIRIADLRNEEQEATPIVYNGRAQVSSTGRPIKLTPISALSYEPSSAFASSRRTEEKSTPKVEDHHSFV